MKRRVIRRAEPQDAESIARVCAAGWRDTYRGIKEPERIEAVIAEYYRPERIRREIGASEGWDPKVAGSIPARPICRMTGEQA